MVRVLAQTRPTSPQLLEVWSLVTAAAVVVLAVLFATAVMWSVLRGRRLRRELQAARDQRRQAHLKTLHASPRPTPSEPWQAAGERMDKPQDAPAEPGSDEPFGPLDQADIPFDFPPFHDDDDDDDDEEDDEEEQDTWWKRGDPPPF